MKTKKEDKMKRFLIILLISLLFTFFCVTSFSIAAEKVYKWRAVSHQVVGTVSYEKTVVPFCEMVEKASNGRLIIEPYGGGVLFPSTEILDNVKNGVVQMAMVWSGYWAGKNPIFALAGSRPGDPITSFSENFYRSEKLAPLLSEAFSKYGVTSLGAFDFAPVEILMSGVPIRSLKDFKGKNVRTGGLGASFYPLLGASAVSIAVEEIYTALQIGTVDIAEYAYWLLNEELGFNEVTKYVIEPCMHTGTTDDKELLVNTDAWNDLPDDLKNIVLACRDMARYLSAVAYDVENQKAKERWVKDYGIEIITLPEEDVKEARRLASKLVVDFSKKNPETEEYVKVYAEVLNDLGYIDIAKELGYGE